jgi:CRP-like cAMP-binding protein
MNTEDFVLRPHPFLAGMRPDHLRFIAEHASEAHFAAGDLLFREGDAANRFFLIERGEIALQTHAAGQAHTVQSVGDGDVVGWSWLFPPHCWRFDARAAKDTDAIVVHAELLREECEVNESLGFQLMKRVSNVVTERLQATRQKLVQAQRAAGAGKNHQV